MKDTREFSDVMQLIYGAGLDFMQWPVVLERLANILGASVTAMVRHDLATSAGAMIMVGTDPKFALLYEERFAKLNVFAQRAGNPAPETCITDRMVLPKEEFFRSEFFAGFLEPQNVHSLLNVYLLQDSESMTQRIAFGRPRRAGEWNPEHIDNLRLFAPHLHRAARISQRLEANRFVAESAADTLDSLVQGVFVVDATARPYFVNRCAERLLAAADGIAIDAHGLRASKRGQTSLLRRMIADAASAPAERPASGTISIERPSQKRSLSVLVVPLRTSPGWFLHRRSGAIVFVKDPECGAPIPKVMLKQFFGLTSRETEVALEIIRGGGLQDAADALGVTLSTARSHLQRVFEKTQTHRQAELVRLITGTAL